MTKKKISKKAREKQILDRIDEIGKDNETTFILLGNPPECVDAILGITYTNPPRLVYSREKYLEGLMRANKWSWDEAVEWFEYNTVRGLDYVTDGPILVDTSCLENI